MWGEITQQLPFEYKIRVFEKWDKGDDKSPHITISRHSSVLSLSPTLQKSTSKISTCKSLLRKNQTKWGREKNTIYLIHIRLIWEFCGQKRECVWGRERCMCILLKSGRRNRLMSSLKELWPTIKRNNNQHTLQRIAVRSRISIQMKPICQLTNQLHQKRVKEYHRTTLFAFDGLSFH